MPNSNPTYRTPRQNWSGQFLELKVLRDDNDDLFLYVSEYEQHASVSITSTGMTHTPYDAIVRSRVFRLDETEDLTAFLDDAMMLLKGDDHAGRDA